MSMYIFVVEAEQEHGRVGGHWKFETIAHKRYLLNKIYPIEANFTFIFKKLIKIKLQLCCLRVWAFHWVLRSWTALYCGRTFCKQTCSHLSRCRRTVWHHNCPLYHREKKVSCHWSHHLEKNVLKNLNNIL